MFARFSRAFFRALYTFAFDDPCDARYFPNALFAFVGLGHGHGDLFRVTRTTAFHFALPEATLATPGRRGGHVFANGLVVPARELFFFEGHNWLINLFQVVPATAFAALVGRLNIADNDA